MPRKVKLLPNHNELLGLLIYNASTGQLVAISKTVKFYRLPGGYLQVSINGEQYLSHRIIWKMVTGNDPIGEVDHIDGDAANNKWINLRIATSAQNNRNRRRSRRNTSGAKGVMWEKNRNKWCACVSIGRKHIIKRFADYNEACRAVSEMRRGLHGDFARDV